MELLSPHFIMVKVDRQRQRLSGIDELAKSILRNGLINPIVIDEDNILLAGERRLQAVRVLMEEGKLPQDYKIKTQTFSGLDEHEKQIIELEENLRRNDITWKEAALAIARMYDICLQTEGQMSQDKYADKLGFTREWINKNIAVAQALRDEVDLVCRATSLSEAYNALSRILERKKADENNKLDEALCGAFETSKTEAKNSGGSDQSLQENNAGTSDSLVQSDSIADVPFEIRNIDFLSWIDSYSGPRFNLLHCDFPYGINHDKSSQGGADTWGAYDDSPEVYWDLCKGLASRVNEILYPSAHVIFWLSLKYYEETVEFFNQHMPDFDIYGNPLIWHKSDNKGIIQQANHTPRHIYESALFMWRGGRKVVQSVADLYSCPTQKSKGFHISEKPVPMLRHFFRMVVDENTAILDPTAGSGSALRAALSMGAERGLGLELNPDYAGAAQRELDLDVRKAKAAKVLKASE